MKYEYLKGSEKDFEGAPEWATHVIEHKEGNQRAFAEKFDYMCRAVYAADAELYPDSKTVIANPTMWIVIADRELVDVEFTGKTPWDGVGLPPVGCECEFTLGPYEPYEFDELVGKLPWPGTLVTVVSHKVTGDGHDVAVIYWDEDGGGLAACLVGSCLKPIRSGADKKRDAALLAMNIAVNEGESGVIGGVVAIYDAIAAGKIPGVNLED
jgi:hypothetical protein